MNTPALRRAAFLLLLVIVTMAFFWMLAPFFGAVLWAVTLALLFHPMNKRMQRRLGGRATLSALLTLALCLVIVILPMIAIGTSLVSDLLSFTQKVRGGEIDYRSYFQQIIAALPPWLSHWLDSLGIMSLENIVDKVSSGLLQGGQLVATHALELGQNTFQFLVSFVIMLYLLFFLLRDGVKLSRMIKNAVPLEPHHTQFLLGKFSTVVRATVKGTVVVALVQGFLGGLAFIVLGLKGAVLWGVVMAVLSLLPAVGAALVWAPVAIYLLATGSVWQGVALTLWGVLAIGMSDNALRPILVGKDTKLPDYLVLISTIGGMSVLGINGFVIGPTIAAMFVACWAVFAEDGSSASDEVPDPGNPEDKSPADA